MGSAWAAKLYRQGGLVKEGAQLFPRRCTGFRPSAFTQPRQFFFDHGKQRPEAPVRTVSPMNCSTTRS